MDQRKYLYATKAQLLTGVVVVAIILTAVFFGVFRYINSNNGHVIPRAIQQKITYQVYAPQIDDTVWKVLPESIKYDDKQGLLSLTIASSNIKLFVTEQNTPAQFTDIPQYYPALMGKLNQYSVVQTSLGEVALTHPKELNGNQTAVSNSHGTLMFVRPQNSLTDTQWQQFFNTLIIAR